MDRDLDTVLLNVCIIPPNDIGNRCIEISQGLKSSSTLFVLGGDKFAHMTVFMARFPTSSIKTVINTVEHATTTIKPFACIHNGYFLTAGRYLEVSYQKTAPFIGLQQKVIASISKFRAQPGSSQEESYYEPYSSEQQRNVRDTGYDLVGNLYRPHITLTRYASGQAPTTLPSLPATNLSFDLSQLAIYKADNNGAVYEKLASFSI